ncbi:hypothetical protein JCM8208_002707 [Rhodotorula glutinis]
MNFNGLHFPRPADPNSLPPLPSTSTSTSSSPPSSAFHAAAQSRSYASQRQEARTLRQDRRKSPFVPRTSHQSTPHSLALLSPAQLEDRLERTTRLLETGGAAQMPGGDARLRDQHDRIVARLAHLKDLDQIRHDLADTHLDGATSVPDGDAMVDVKPAPAPVDDEAASPGAKRRIAAAAFLKNSGPTPGSSSSTSSGTAALSLHDSLALQRRAAALDRARAERRALRAAAIGAPATASKGKGVARGGEELDPDDDGGMFGGILFPTGNDTDDSLSESEADDWLQALAGARRAAAQGEGARAGGQAGATVGRGAASGGGRKGGRGGRAPSTGPHSASASGLSTPSRAALLGPDDDDDDDDDDHVAALLDGAHAHELEAGDAKYDEVNGALLDDDEDAQLNPLRTAYMSGWERAVKEEQEG